MSEREYELIEVACPDCGNANRHARRRCKAIGGMCKGAGTVVKRVPVRSKPKRVPLSVVRDMAGAP